MAEHCSRLHADLFAVNVPKFLPHIRNYDVDGPARAKHESPKFASHLFLSHSPPPKLKLHGKDLSAERPSIATPATTGRVEVFAKTILVT